MLSSPCFSFDCYYCWIFRTANVRLHDSGVYWSIVSQSSSFLLFNLGKGYFCPKFDHTHFWWVCIVRYIIISVMIFCDIMLYIISSIMVFITHVRTLFVWNYCLVWEVFLLAVGANLVFTSEPEPSNNHKLPWTQHYNGNVWRMSDNVSRRGGGKRYRSLINTRSGLGFTWLWLQRGVRNKDRTGLGSFHHQH